MTLPRWVRDPATPSMLLFGAMVAGGFAAVVAGWIVVARTLVVAFQVPALVSGGLGGLALIVTGAGLATVQAGRRLAARERAEVEAVLGEAALLVAAAAKRSR